MRSNYEEKKANRIERYNRLAARFEGESASRYKRFHDLLSVIPMGQPILVGHHSEAGHRSLLKKADNNMRKSIECDKKATYYSGKAETAESNYAISSDDVNALDRLREKLKEREDLQAYMKKINSLHAKYSKSKSLAVLEGLSEKEINRIINYVPQYTWEKHPFAPYQISNNNQNISSIKKRIAKLETMEAAENKETVFGDIRIMENAEENRVQIFFPGKPADEIRSKLKSGGFRWSPMNGCWQAFYSNYSKWRAEEIVKSINPIIT